LNTRGRQAASWVDAGTAEAVLADASPTEQLRWKQVQRPVTHSITAKGAPQAKPGDRLVFNNRHFYVQGVENPGGLGLWTIYHCEERKDA